MIRKHRRELATNPECWQLEIVDKFDKSRTELIQRGYELLESKRGLEVRVGKISCSGCELSIDGNFLECTLKIVPTTIANPLQQIEEMITNNGEESGLRERWREVDVIQLDGFRPQIEVSELGKAA